MLCLAELLFRTYLHVWMPEFTQVKMYNSGGSALDMDTIAGLEWLL